MYKMTGSLIRANPLRLNSVAACNVHKYTVDSTYVYAVASEFAGRTTTRSCSAFGYLIRPTAFEAVLDLQYTASSMQIID